MEWNMAAECISLVFLCIIWTYFRQSHLLPTLKNKLFQGCFFTTFTAMFTNLLSAFCIMYIDKIPITINWLFTTIYFISTPLMGLVYFYYTVSIIYEEEDRIPTYFYYMLLPAAFYMYLIAGNPFTHALFDISREGGYVQGNMIDTTYIVFYFYCIACFILVLLKRKRLDFIIRNILMIFPIVALLVVVIQEMFPHIVLSGSAATCALLIIYLYLQNKQISVDYMLGIPNKMVFMNTMKLRMKQSPEEPFTVIMLSLRNFKQINDTYGQQMGDEFIKKVCEFMKQLANPHKLYRFGGDEFIILVKSEVADEIEGMVTNLFARMSQIWNIRHFSSLIGGAIGIIRYPDCGKDMEEMINAIEYTIFRAKTGGYPYICYCTPEFLEAVKRKNKVIEIIEETLEHDGFDVYFQPIWSVKEKRFVLAESLLRLMDSPIGPIYPSELIPIAEETGLISDMTYQILNKVCKFVKRLIKQGADFESITVNFSGMQFGQKDLIKTVFSIIEQNQIPFEKIKIEITESVMADNQEQVLDFINQIHEKGIQVGIDDFGTGYCNLVSVISMPVDVVKMDKSLLWSAMDNEKSAIMMKNMTRTVQEMGMRVVSEGVESKEQKEFVEECGCDWIQGFLFARPMPADAALNCFLENNV